jgi:hypothetical protein
MKTTLFPVSALAALIAISGCFVVSHEHSFYKTPAFKPDATFKIIAVNTDDILLGRLESHLLRNGFTLVSDNYLRGALPAGRTTIATGDTTYQIPNHEMVALRYVEERPADYVIRYQYQLGVGYRLTMLNITVVNTATSATEASFAFPQRAKATTQVIGLDDALRLFVSKLKGR